MTALPEIISHRGGALLWPENSLIAFRGSLALPLDQVECDIHLAADGVPVVIHDATLDRVTEAKGAVASLTADALAAIRLRGAPSEGVPSLASVAALFRASRVRLRVEIKPDAHGRPYPGIVRNCLATLQQAQIRESAVLIGFQPESMAEAQSAGGLHGVSWLIEAKMLRELGALGVIAAARAWGFADLGFPASVLDAPVVAAMQAAGFAVNAWGADDAVTIRRLTALGIAAFATDDPILALSLRG